MKNNRPIKLFVVSDSLGEMGKSIASALKAQFAGSFGAIKRFPFVMETTEIDDILAEARAAPCMIIYTLVLAETRAYIASKGKEFGLPLVDILGDAMRVAEEITGKQPINEAGLNRRLDKEYFHKVAAVEFAVKYDDGTDPSCLKRADIVLVGISRTSKTPLSMYLAYRNYKVANVPLILGVEPPEELFNIDRRKIIGLTNDPDRLLSIRTERLKDLGIEKSENYANMEMIKMELDYANDIFEKLGCPVINVVSRSVEETAVMIITRLNKLYGER